MFFDVVIILLIILHNSSQSLCIELKASFLIYSVLFNIFSQYSVSLASLYEIESLLIKSFFDCPPRASSILAPIDVPLLKTCFDKIYSFLNIVKYLYKLTIRIENLKDLS